MDDEGFEDDPGLSDNELNDEQREQEVVASLDVESAQDADEDLNLAGIQNQAWLAKLPRYLVARWFESERPQDSELGKLRVTKERYPDGTEKVTKMQIVVEKSLVHPKAKDAIPAEYTTSFTNAQPANTHVFATNERIEEDEARPGKKRRIQMPHVVGTVVHEVNSVPQGDPTVYGSLLRQKLRQAAAPSRPVKVLDDQNEAFRNRFASGVHSISQSRKFDQNFIRGVPAKSSSATRAARIPKNELLDKLFKLFDERPHWRIQELRERTNQPLEYLREVLLEIAVLIRGGEMNGMWKLNDQMADERLKQQQNQTATQQEQNDDDSDDDMEEVV